MIIYVRAHYFKRVFQFTKKNLLTYSEKPSNKKLNTMLDLFEVTVRQLNRHIHISMESKV